MLYPSDGEDEALLDQRLIEQMENEGNPNFPYFFEEVVVHKPKVIEVSIVLIDETLN